MQVLRVRSTPTGVEADNSLLPHRDARDKGPADVIPCTAFWLTRAEPNDIPDPVGLGNHAIVVLSGEVRASPRGAHVRTLTAGDVLVVDVKGARDLGLSWDGFAWLLYLACDGWMPEAGDDHVRADPVTRAGRPLLTWIYDDDGQSRSEPLRWPTSLAPVPAVEQWPRSRGAFVTRRDYGDDGFLPGVWHNGPRPQLGVTLNGRAENETGDGTVTSPVAGDIAYIDDVTGAGHLTRGQGERWMLFVTVAPGHLDLTPER